MTQKQLFHVHRRKVVAKGKNTDSMRRSLESLRKDGYRAEKCEQYKPWVRKTEDGKPQITGGHKSDLFGFADILAFNGVEVIAVQTTSVSKVSAHLRAYRKNQETANAIRDWIASDSRRFVIHGWEPLVMKTKAGGEKVRWSLIVRELTMDDLQKPNR